MDPYKKTSPVPDNIVNECPVRMEGLVISVVARSSGHVEVLADPAHRVVDQGIDVLVDHFRKISDSKFHVIAPVKCDQVEGSGAVGQRHQNLIET